MNQQKKFALGGGSYCLYAPLFPRFQYLPGFADEVLIFNAKLPSLFALAVVVDGVALTLNCTGMKMRDGAAVLSYETGIGLKVTETRFVSADERFVSKLELQNTSKHERELFIVLWTTTDPEGEAVSLEGDSFRVRRSLQSDDCPPVPVEILWSSPDSKGARCLQAYFAEGGSDRPDFEETPWAGMASFPTPRAKRPMQKPSPILPNSRVYAGLFRPVKLKGNSKVEHRFEARAILKGKGVNYRPRRPDSQDENGYAAFMARAPKFTCEWKALERIVQHRLQALYMMRIPHGAGHMTAPNICAGNGPFHHPVSFAAPANMREARWLSVPGLARGIIRGFFENIRQNGMVPGRLHLTALQNAGFFHADWGGGFEALDCSHPDRATKRAVLMPMQRYVKWLANNRDPEGSGLTDVVHHSETGQALSRRYTVIDDKSDRAEESGEQFRLKGVDASVFRYRMVKFLIHVADEMQEKAMANRFIAEAEVIHDIMRKRMWDENTGLFMDIDPKSRRRTGVKSAVGFYPMGTDIPTPDMVEKMLSTLGSRKEFWSKYPIPSLSMDDPYYNPDGHWKGTRREGPWNGRVWPIINSHVLEGLAYVAERGNKKAQKLTGELFKRTMTMVSGELEGLEEARTFEHYSPETGKPSRFRGVDFCMQSFLLDNIFRIGCGVAVRFGDLKDDPVMGDMPDFKLHGVPVGNKRFNAERKNGKLKIVMD